jgi:RNA helicase
MRRAIGDCDNRISIKAVRARAFSVYWPSPYSEHYMTILRRMGSSYFIVRKETNGLKIYISFSNQRVLSALESQLPRECDVDIALRSAADNIAECKAGDYEEEGIIPSSSLHASSHCYSGVKRGRDSIMTRSRATDTAMTTVWDTLETNQNIGSPEKKIIKLETRSTTGDEDNDKLSSHSDINDISTKAGDNIEKMRHREKKTTLHVYTGESGSGKTLYALRRMKGLSRNGREDDEIYYKDTTARYWPDYKGQRIVLMDDFVDDDLGTYLTWQSLFALASQLPTMIEVSPSVWIPFVSEHLFICSPLHVSQWYRGERRGYDVRSLYSRIDEFRTFERVATGEYRSQTELNRCRDERGEGGFQTIGDVIPLIVEDETPIEVRDEEDEETKKTGGDGEEGDRDTDIDNLLSS